MQSVEQAAVEKSGMELESRSPRGNNESHASTAPGAYINTGTVEGKCRKSIGLCLFLLFCLMQCCTWSSGYDLPGDSIRLTCENHTSRFEHCTSPALVKSWLPGYDLPVNSSRSTYENLTSDHQQSYSFVNSSTICLELSFNSSNTITQDLSVGLECLHGLFQYASGTLQIFFRLLVTSLFMLRLSYPRAGFINDPRMTLFVRFEGRSQDRLEELFPPDIFDYECYSIVEPVVGWEFKFHCKLTGHTIIEQVANTDLVYCYSEILSRYSLESQGQDDLHCLFPPSLCEVTYKKKGRSIHFYIKCKLTGHTLVEVVQAHTYQKAVSQLIYKYGFVAQASSGLVVDVILLAAAIYNHYKLCGRKGIGLYIACMHFIRSQYPQSNGEIFCPELTGPQLDVITHLMRWHASENIPAGQHPPFDVGDDWFFEAQGLEESSFMRSLVKIVSVMIAVFGIARGADLSFTDISKLVSAALNGGPVLTLNTAAAFIAEVQNVFVTLRNFWASGCKPETFFDCNGALRELSMRLQAVEHQHDDIANKVECHLTIELQSLLSELEAIAIKVTKLYSTHPARTLEIRAVELRHKRLFDAVTLSFRNAAYGRVAPFAISLVGNSSVGKTGIINWFLHQFAADNPFIRQMQDSSAPPLDINSVFKHTLGNSQTDLYMTGLANSSWAGVFDDVCVISPKTSPTAYDSFISGLIKIINTFPYRTEQAGLENKGKIFCNFQFVVFTTNVPDFCAPLVCNNPSAVLRRIQYFIEPRVKPEFAKPGSTALDPVKVLAYIDQHQIYNGEPVPIHTYHVWYYRVVGTRAEKVVIGEQLEIEELMAMLREAWTAHARDEVQIIKNTRDVKYCVSCRKVGASIESGLCRTCSQYQGIVLNICSLDTLLAAVLEELFKLIIYEVHPIFVLLFSLIEFAVYVGHGCPYTIRVLPVLLHSLLTAIAVNIPYGILLSILIHYSWNRHYSSTKCYIGLEQILLFTLSFGGLIVAYSVLRKYAQILVDCASQWLCYIKFRLGRFLMMTFYSGLREYALYTIYYPLVTTAREYRARRVNKQLLAMATLALAGLSSAAILWYAASMFKVEPQGNTQSQEVEMGSNFWSNSWASSNLSGSPGTQPAPFEQLVQSNAVVITIGNSSFKALGIGGNYFICTKHQLVFAMNGSDSAKYRVEFSPARNFRPGEGYLDKSNIAYSESSDLAMVELPNQSSLASLHKYFLPRFKLDATTRIGEGKVISLDKGAIVERKFAACDRKMINIQYATGGQCVSLFLAETTLNDRPYQTSKGDCGAVAFCAVRGNCAVLGIHIAGASGTTRSGILPVSHDELTQLRERILRYPRASEDDSVLRLDLESQGKALVTGYHPKCPINFLDPYSPRTEPQCLGNLGPQPQRANRNTNYTHSRFVNWWASKRILPKCAKSMDFNVPLAVPGKFTPAILPRYGWVPKYRFCDVATDLKEMLPVGKIKALANRVRDYYLSHPSFVADLKKVKPLFLDEAINGISGSKFIKQINMKSSAGFPHSGVKKDLFYRKIDRPHQYEAPPFIVDRVNDMEARAKKLVRPGVIFTATFKDEPLNAEKTTLTEEINIALSSKDPEVVRECLRSTKYGKLRIFQAVNVETTILIRKYYLALVSAIQKNGLLTGIAVGINCYSKEWASMLEHLSPPGWGENFICGDFSNYDQRMGKEWLVAAWGVLNDLLLQSDYFSELSHDEQIEFMNLLHAFTDDITSPTTIFFGDILRLSGSNASGHPLTVIINGIANLMYMSYAFECVYPDRDFFTNVRIMTYGDDNILNVHPSCSLFTQPSATLALAQINISYTAADKGVTTSDYCKPTFLKRTWRKIIYERDTEKHEIVVCPIEYATIQKMLAMETKKHEEDLNNRIIQVLGSALFEFMQYGRCPYEQMLNLCNEFICEHKLELHFRVQYPHGWPSYDEYMRSWIEGGSYAPSSGEEDEDTLEC